MIDSRQVAEAGLRKKKGGRKNPTGRKSQESDEEEIRLWIDVGGELATGSAPNRATAHRTPACAISRPLPPTGSHKEEANNADCSGYLSGRRGQEIAEVGATGGSTVGSATRGEREEEREGEEDR